MFDTSITGSIPKLGIGTTTCKLSALAKFTPDFFGVLPYRSSFRFGNLINNAHATFQQERLVVMHELTLLSNFIFQSALIDLAIRE